MIFRFMCSIVFFIPVNYQEFKEVDGMSSVSDMPAPQLPEFQEPKEFYGQMARDFVQFGAGMVMAPGGTHSGLLLVSPENAQAPGLQTCSKKS